MESFLLPELFGDRRVERLHERLLERASPTWLRVQQMDSAELLRALGRGVDSVFGARSGGKRWLDHTSANVFMLETLLTMFPDARVVHVVRDGRLAVQSMLDVVHTEGAHEVEMRSRGFRPEWTEDFASACATWSAAVESGMRACETHPKHVLAVALDDLISDPERAFGTIFAHLALPHEEAPVRFWRRRIAARWDDADPVSTRARARSQWDVWSDEQRAIFGRDAGPTMVRYGLASSAALELRE